MSLKETFDLAVAESQSLTTRPDNDTLLGLYSLYKQATFGNCSDEFTGNPFDFIGKAKYNAWKKRAGMSSEEAMNEYIAIVERLKG